MSCSIFGGVRTKCFEHDDRLKFRIPWLSRFASCGPVCRACIGRPLPLQRPHCQRYGMTVAQLVAQLMAQLRLGGRLGRLGLCPCGPSDVRPSPPSARRLRPSWKQQPCQPLQAFACNMEDPSVQQWCATESSSPALTTWFLRCKIHAAMLRWMPFNKPARHLAHMIFLTVSFTPLASLAQCVGAQCNGQGLVVHS